MMDFPKNLFVVSTSRNVGKTFVSAMLTLGLKAYYWKPIQCGVSPFTDTEWIKETTGLPNKHFLPESYRLGEPILPHSQGIDVEMDILKPSHLIPASAHLIIEGTGGIMTPLNEKEFFIDFMKRIKAPALLVAPSKEGQISDILLAVEKLDAENIPLFGIILNGPKNLLAEQAIKEFCRPPRLFHVDLLSHITEHSLLEAFKEAFSTKDLEFAFDECMVSL